MEQMIAEADPDLGGRERSSRRGEELAVQRAV